MIEREIVDATEDKKEPTDPFELAEKRTQAVMQSIRRWSGLRKDGKHPYTQEQVEAMISGIDQAWDRAKADFEAGAFALPKTS